MRSYDLMNILGRAFAYGEIDNLKKYLRKDCEYISEYSNKKITASEEIIRWMENVNSRIDLESRYTFKIVYIKDIIKEEVYNSLIKKINNKTNRIKGLVYRLAKRVSTQFNINNEIIIPYNNDDCAILLYQYNDEYPVAVVSTETDSKTGKITKILLSRNSEIYNVDFYKADMGEDSPLDLPSTVKSMTHNDFLVKEYLKFEAGQKWAEISEENNDGLYIWRKADEYMKSFLSEMGYKLYETKVFDDCIGYKCTRQNYAYTIYLFANGKKQTVILNGDYCKKFLDYDFSKHTSVLIVHLQVKRYKIGKKINYEFYNHYGNKNSPELWRVINIANKNILAFCPGPEFTELFFKLNYAFNKDSLDIYDCIITKESPKFINEKDKYSCINKSFYTNLNDIHKKYGDMKYGCVSFDGIIYSMVNYIDNYGYFGFSLDSKNNRITDINFYPFDKNKIKNFIGTDEVDDDNLLEVIPNLIKVETFPSVDSERFALKLFYDNGECKKYVIPIKRENEKDEAVSYQNHVFTDKIWQSAKISDDCSPEIIGYSNRFPKIIFDNGFFLSSLLCYYEGSDYSEPELTDDIIYEDENCILKRIWKWNVNSVYEDSDGLWKKHNDYKITRTGLLKVLITGSAFNDFQSTSTFITMEGKRLNGLDFDYIDSFSEGYARVAKIGYGYGFIDVNLKFTIPMQFEYAENFVNGYAKIQQNNDWYLIDKNGNKIDKIAKSNNKKYQEIAEYYEGMCRVSTLKLRQYDLAYHSDDASIAGIWGFVNENGEELIAPQYIYANDFEKGMAIVCKGKWTIDKKWDNDCNKGRYWTEMELWGAIDKDGNEVIPFIFDEVKYFNDYDEALIVHYGGWEKGKWGVIDRTGKWLAEPIFEDIDYDYFDGMFAFYKEDKWSDDDVPLGIYDIKQQKVLFEPQFLDVDFLEDGWFKVEVYDEKLGRKIEKIIDKNGKEKFYSNYSYIFDWNRNEGALEVIIRIREDNKEDKRGLIDKNGKILYPCEYNIKEFYYKERLIKFINNDKVGLKDFEGNIIIPPDYSEISDIDEAFYSVKVEEGEDSNSWWGLITPNGKEVIPCEFKSICWLQDGKHILCCRQGFCQMLEYIEK